MIEFQVLFCFSCWRLQPPGEVSHEINSVGEAAFKMFNWDIVIYIYEIQGEI